MRQVNRDEMAWKTARALASLTPAMRNMLVDRRREVRDRGIAIVAYILVDGAFRGVEVLTDAPPTEEEAFTRPMRRMLGERVPSGAVPIQMPDVGIPTE